MDDDIRLRHATARDAEALHAVRHEPEASAYQPLREYSLERLRQILATRSEATIGPKFAGKTEWVMEHHGQVAGWVTLDVTDRDRGIGSIGYTVSSAHHDRGFATRAVQEVIAIAFDSAGFGLQTLQANAAETNAASRRVLAKCGFTLSGITHGFLEIDGEPVDHVHFELRRVDWPMLALTARPDTGSAPTE